MRGNLLSDRLFKRVIAATKRSERQYRNTRDHRRRNVTRGGGGGTQIAMGTLSAILFPGSSAAFSFVIGGTGADTCYDAGSPGGLLCTGDSLAIGTTVVVAKMTDFRSGQTHWYVIQASCGC